MLKTNKVVWNFVSLVWFCEKPCNKQKRICTTSRLNNATEVFGKGISLWVFSLSFCTQNDNFHFVCNFCREIILDSERFCFLTKFCLMANLSLIFFCHFVFFFQEIPYFQNRRFWKKYEWRLKTVTYVAKWPSFWNSSESPPAEAY